MGKALSPEMLMEARKIFADNGWMIDSDKNKVYSLFNRYCRRLKKLENDTQRRLVLELTQRYIWIDQPEYSKHFQEVLIKAFDDSRGSLYSAKEVYVTQLMSPEDDGKIKSSGIMLYILTGHGMIYDGRLSKVKFNTYAKVENKIVNEINQSRLILVDDFLGTGDTALKCIDFLEDMGIDRSKITIIVLVAHNDGVEKIRKRNIEVYSDLIIGKGISDHYKGIDYEKNVKTMERIEKCLSVKDKFRFGYGQSEALVSMIRTPNNTFPVFWKDSSKDKEAPFSRRGGVL